MKTVALFDVCGTLYDSNTTYDFMHFFLRRNDRGRYYRYRFMKSILLKPLWKLLILINGNNKFNRKIFLAMLKGYQVEKVKQEAAYFVENYLSQKQNKQLHEALNQHLSGHHQVALLSASIEPVIEAIANHLNVKMYFATRLGVSNERYNGIIEYDMEGNKNKAFENHFSDFKEAFVYFYSDNKEDINLLELVQKPVVVCKETTRIHYWQPKIKNPLVEYILKI